jgi:hypothetical protein
MNFGVTEGVLAAIALAVLILPVVALVLGIRWAMKRKAGRKSCPFCAETINMAAQICRFCQRQVA